jgi:Fe-S oxidoreductase
VVAVSRSVPAHAAGANLSPKFLITKPADMQRGDIVTMKDGSQKMPEAATSGRGAFDAIALLEQGFYDENEIWSCTTCGACIEECPGRSTMSTWSSTCVAI